MRIENCTRGVYKRHLRQVCISGISVEQFKDMDETSKAISREKGRDSGGIVNEIKEIHKPCVCPSKKHIYSIYAMTLMYLSTGPDDSQ